MSSVLVLNYDFTPLNVTSFRRGFVLVNKGKAEIIRSDEKPLTNGYKNFVKPLIIRLLNYIKYYTKNISPTRNRIYKRDDNQCVYCGSKKQLTIDHVLPKSRGGKNEWTNLVTCCFKCNVKKANRTPEEANMKMTQVPYIPQILVENTNLKKIWADYQKSFV